MRLLHTKKLEVVDVADDSIPEYAVLSHTWGPKEVSFQDLERLAIDSMMFSERQKVISHPVFSKVVEASSLALQKGYDYIWIDTCCIDKTSSAELSEAINSMYRWYEQAAVCFVYLADVAPVKYQDQHASKGDTLELSNFRQSRWFTRGWTLQELIAPKDVQFYAQDWTYIGSHKEKAGFRGLLSQITGIDDRVLEGSLSPQDLSVSARMKWAALRKTTRIEDIAYCLMGIFGVNMPLLYGEGKRAFIRLQEEILKETDDQSLFAWTSPATDDKARDRLSGLLAESPYAFKDVGNVRPLPPILTRDSVPSNITNQGLRIQLYLAPAGDEGQNSAEEEYHAILDCSLREGYRDFCPTIHLRRLWGDQFARVRSHKCILLPPPADEIPTYGKGYQIIYVKQRPVYIIPQFTLPTRDGRIPATISESESYRLIDVYPPERWHSDSLSLKSVYSQLDRVMGIFRFEHPLTPNLHVDVAVGLRRLSQKAWESWCFQKRCGGDPLNRVFEMFDQMLRDNRNHSGPASNYQIYLGEDHLLDSEARVIETQMHGRSYITLYVFSKPEILSRELTAVPIETYASNDVQTPHSSAIYPNISTAAGVNINLDDEVRTLTMACTIEDTVDLSIFPTSERTTRVRINPPVPEVKRTCIDLFRDLLSSVPIRSRTVGYLSPSQDNLSIELLCACKEGDITKVERLIRKKAFIEVVTQNFHSFRPIHWATVGGHLPIIRLLLGAGAEEYPLTSENMTPIHLAAMMGHLDIITYFLEKAVHTGMSTDILLDARISGTLETPYHLVAAYAAPELTEKFLDTLYSFRSNVFQFPSAANYLDETPLHRAAAMNNAEAVKYILRSNPGFKDEPIGAFDQFGRTAMWHAACAGSLDVIRILGVHKESLDLADDFGRAPLHAACREGRTAAVSTLLNMGANPDCVTSPLGLTPSHYAALFGHAGCLHALSLRRAKTDAGTVDSFYFRPIHLAAANGWLQCVRELCSLNSDPDIPSSHYILVDADGTGVRLVGRQTRSAEEIALIQGHDEIVQFFKNRKARQEKQTDEVTTVAQRRNSERRQSVIDLGLLQGALTPPITGTAVEAV